MSRRPVSYLQRGHAVQRIPFVKFNPIGFHKQLLREINLFSACLWGYCPLDLNEFKGGREGLIGVRAVAADHVS